MPAEQPPTTMLPPASELEMDIEIEALEDETPAAARSTSEDPLALELHAVAQAERWLSATPARSLSLLEDTETRVGTGYLQPERRYLTIRALFALGRRTEAEKMAKQLLYAQPRGPFTDALNALLGNRSRPSSHP